MALTQGPTSANERLRQALAKQATETGRQALQETASFAGSAAFNGRCRLLLSAELAAPDGLVRLVEAHNAQVVAEDSDLDERDLAWTVPTEGETVDDLLLALAQAYLDRSPSPRPRDLPRRLAYFSGLLAERSVSGVICAYSNFCDLYLAEFPSLRAHLRGLGVPVLLLELEDEAISGQHRTRVEAFLELTGSS
ncbi:MAG: 2-hydroxyacyl-CoA dehydratase, partial [Anaerolineales bacterium]